MTTAETLQRTAEVLREYADMIEESEVHRSGPRKGKMDDAPQDEVDEYRELADALALIDKPALRLFETRVDCWYQPHKDPGAKVKQPQRVVVTLIHEAADSEDAIKRAREWADSNAPGSKGRKLLSIEHRSTGPKKLPIATTDGPAAR